MAEAHAPTDMAQSSGNSLPGRPRRQAVLAWALLGLLLALQWGLFRYRVNREVAFAIPRGFDQACYLDTAYRIHEVMACEGVVEGLRFAFTRPIANGLLLHTHAALLFSWFGPTRQVALTLNFAWFITFQIVLFATLHWASRRWALAFFGLGLLLTVATPFLHHGGILDFRIDFIAFCLFGIFLCAVVRSNCFGSRRWALAVGGVAATLVLYRYLTAVYLGGILGTYMLLFAARACFGSSLEGRQAARRRLVGLTCCGTVLVLIGLPVLLLQHEHLWNYYVINHILGQEKYIRAAEMGVGTPSQSLFYYASAVGAEHTSRTFGALAALGLVASFLMRPSGTRRPSHRTAWAFLGTSLLLPYVILTLNISKSPVVGSILVPPLLLLALLPLLQRCGSARGPALTGLAIVALVWGVSWQISKSNHRGTTRVTANSLASVAVHDAITLRCEALGLRHPRVSVDAITDLLGGCIFNVVAFERHDARLDVRPLLGASIYEIDEAHTLAFLQQSDFVVLTDGCMAEVSAYPFTQAMQALRPRIREHCDRNLTLLGEFPVAGKTLRLYARPELAPAVSAAEGTAQVR